MKRVTIRDVAREAGVSVPLVSFVMNAKRDKDGNLINCPVNANTAKRVTAVAQRLGYHRNFAAASLRSGRSNTIAVIPNDISNKFFAGISRVIEEEALKFGYNVFFASSEEKGDLLSNLIDTFVAHNVDGMIVAPCAGSEEAIKRTVGVRIPVVLLDRDIDEEIPGVGKVLLDDEQAGYMAAQLMLDRGYKNIEMISYTLGISSLSERENGYRKAMMDSDLYDKVKIHYTTYGSADSDIEKIVREAKENGVDGFFLPTYSISAKVLAVMKKLGYKTPDDFALVCFDESDVYTLYENTVTHIIQPLKELGVKSVDTLIDMIQGKNADTVKLQASLVEGESTAQKK